MRNETREILDKYALQIATLNGVSDVSKSFNVQPSVQQTIETRMQESSEFLSKINMVGVVEQQGTKLGLGIGSPIASNTDTSSKDRTTSDPTDITDNHYHCRKNNSDTHLKYAKLDMWAKYPNFQELVRDTIIKRQALDRMTIAFNGTSYALDSNKVTNPLLQDVNIGWLQKMRTHAAARVLDQGEAGGNILVKTGGDYENLDALVMDSVNNLIAPWYQDDTELVVIMGRDLLHDKYFPLVNQSQPNSEKLAADLIISQKRVGGLSAVRAPFFPAGTIFITRLDNLSIYFQEGKRRRHIEENPKRDQIENYESSNDDYIVEDYEMAALIENIQLGE